MSEPSSHPNQTYDKRAHNHAEPERVRVCDLFGVINRAADEAAAEAFSRGLALSLQFDPQLRDARIACPASVAQAMKTTIRAMLLMTRRGAVSLRATAVGERVTIEVSSLLDGYNQPDAGLFAQAAEQARALGGRLSVDRAAACLGLSLVFPAPPSPMTVLPIEPDWPGASVEATELETVQAGEDADEDDDSQDRDHGRLVSAKVRTA